jgi:hypothetical protein
MAATTALPTSPEKFDALLLDACRYAEGILTRQQVRKRHPFGDEMWEVLGINEDFCEKIEDLRLRRIRDGSSARERAQKHFATAPDVLGAILNDNDASPRHRIESAKELRVVADNGPQATPPDERFVININIGTNTLRIDTQTRPLTPEEARRSVEEEARVIEHAPLIPVSEQKDDERW